MGYALFLGCLVPLRYPGIEASVRAVMPRLGIKLYDIRGASCCPAPGLTKPLDRKTWLALGARNICLAEEMGLDIVTVCNGCLLTLSEVNHSLKADPDLRREINAILSTIGMRFRGSIRIHHFVDVLFEDIGLKRIKREVVAPLKGLKVAPHYGCHYMKVAGRKEPIRLEGLIETVGAQVVGYSENTMCCGAGKGVRSSMRGLSLEIAKQKIKSFSEANVDCVVDICPFCHLQFDRGQAEIWKEFGVRFNIPVLYVSQLLGMAFGIPIRMGLSAHVIPAEKLFKCLQQ
jgi:heterodisulfide reductase subunit B